VDHILLNHYPDHSTDDLELIASYKQSHDLAVVGTLFKRYKHLVYGVCMKYLKDPDESQDAVMQIFEKLISDLKKHEIGNFRPWLHAVAKNHCLMQLRKKKSKGREYAGAAETSAEVVEMNLVWHPADSAEKEVVLQHLEGAIQQLNEGQKKCIELFYLQEKSYQQVAELTGYSLLQVKSYIQNGKRNLKILMENKNAGAV